MTAQALEPIVAGLAPELVGLAIAFQDVAVSGADQALDGDVDIAGRLSRIARGIPEIDLQGLHRAGVAGIVRLPDVGSAIEPVGACAAFERIVAVAAGEGVGAIPAFERVVAVIPPEDVAAEVRALHHIRKARAVDHLDARVRVPLAAPVFFDGFQR